MVANDSPSCVETLVASRRSGSDVMGGLLGSLGASAGCSAVGSCSTQVEQKMLRAASAAPDWSDRSATAAVGAGRTGRAMDRLGPLGQRGGLDHATDRAGGEGGAGDDDRDPHDPEVFLDLCIQRHPDGAQEQPRCHSRGAGNAWPGPTSLQIATVLQDASPRPVAGGSGRRGGRAAQPVVDRRGQRRGKAVDRQSRAPRCRRSRSSCGPAGRAAPRGRHAAGHARGPSVCHRARVDARSRWPPPRRPARHRPRAIAHHSWAGADRAVLAARDEVHLRRAAARSPLRSASCAQRSFSTMSSPTLVDAEGARAGTRRAGAGSHPASRARRAPARPARRSGGAAPAGGRGRRPRARRPGRLRSCRRRPGRPRPRSPPGSCR